MSSVGIIAEYNPFHNGHFYHIKESKRITGADTVICTMSGDFVQRGEPAVIDKYTRCQMALENGADLLTELPVFYACASAEIFAYGAVHTLVELGADYLCFGSECGDIAILTAIAETLAHEPAELSALIRDKVATGVTYPAARTHALGIYFKHHPDVLSSHCEISDNFNSTLDYVDWVLKSPNNILGIEYIKIIIKENLSIKPYTITRNGSNYNDTKIRSSMPSATSIRTAFSQKEVGEIQDIMEGTMPANAFHTLLNAYGKTFPIAIDDFSCILNAQLQRMLNVSPNTLLQYADINQSLANRIVNTFTGYETITEYAIALKSRQMTYARVSRVLLHIIIDRNKSLDAKYIGYGVPYIRILGFSPNGQNQLSIVKKTTTSVIITKPASYKELLREDIFASNLYSMIVHNKYGVTPISELKHSPIRTC